jgi:type I restriction enzyme R subunit
MREEFLAEEPLHIDLLRKDKLTKAEEKKVKLAAKELNQTLIEKNSNFSW